MPPLSGPFLVAATVLALGGLLKLARPDDTAGALRAMHLPSHRALVRLMGSAEIGLGLGALFVPGPLFPALVAIAYLSFAAFVIVALQRNVAIQSCGCFGRVDTPPSMTHVVVNMLAAATASIVGLTSAPTIASQIANHPTEAWPLAALSGVGVYLIYVALTGFPETMSEVRKRTA